MESTSKANDSISRTNTTRGSDESQIPLYCVYIEPEGILNEQFVFIIQLIQTHVRIRGIDACYNKSPEVWKIRGSPFAIPGKFVIQGWEKQHPYLFCSVRSNILELFRLKTTDGIRKTRKTCIRTFGNRCEIVDCSTIWTLPSTTRTKVSISTIYLHTSHTQSSIGTYDEILRPSISRYHPLSFHFQAIA